MKLWRILLSIFALVCICCETSNSPSGGPVGVPGNHAPVFQTDSTDIGGVAVPDSVFRDTLVAVDVDGDSITWILVDAPFGMRVSSGIIEWTPSSEDTGDNKFRLIAMDPLGLSDTLFYNAFVGEVPRVYVHFDAHKSYDKMVFGAPATYHTRVYTRNIPSGADSVSWTSSRDGYLGKTPLDSIGRSSLNYPNLSFGYHFLSAVIVWREGLTLKGWAYVKVVVPPPVALSQPSQDTHSVHLSWTTAVIPDTAFRSYEVHRFEWSQYYHRNVDTVLAEITGINENHYSDSTARYGRVSNYFVRVLTESDTSDTGNVMPFEAGVYFTLPRYPTLFPTRYVNNKVLAAYGNHAEGGIVEIDLNTFSSTVSFAIPITEKIEGIDINVTGDTAIVGFEKSKEIWFVPLATKKVSRKITLEKGMVHIQFGPKGRIFYTTGHQWSNIVMANPITGKTLSENPRRLYNVAFVFGPNGDYLYGYERGITSPSLYKYDIKTDSIRFTGLKCAPSQWSSGRAVITNDGKYLFAMDRKISTIDLTYEPGRTDIVADGSSHNSRILFTSRAIVAVEDVSVIRPMPVVTATRSFFTRSDKEIVMWANPPGRMYVYRFLGN